MSLTHFSLFTGIGGIDLAAEWAGFESVGQCEFADYPTKVLEKHWPDVPRWKDVRDVTAESIRERGIEKITLLSGGFPCQPHSVAGLRKASDDERDLWGEFARIICEVRPEWVLAENVSGLLTSESGRFFGRVLRDLAVMGYSVGWASIQAAWVGAVHRRERIFIVAHANSVGLESQIQKPEIVNQILLQQSSEKIKSLPAHVWVRRLGDHPGLRRLDGVSDWVYRIKTVGNAACPQQVYPILKSIADIATAQ